MPAGGGGSGSILEGLSGGNFSVRREHWLAADGLDRIALEHMHTDREFGLGLRRASGAGSTAGCGRSTRTCTILPA